MSERDVRRVEVLAEVLSGRRTVASAAIVLAVGVRQIHRLLIRFLLYLLQVLSGRLHILATDGGIV
jgi:hypothetical protein